MKYIFAIVFLITQYKAVSQSTDRLDNNNGFKKFKFGLSPSQFTSITEDKRAQVKQTNVKNYIYNGEDITDLFGVRIESIQLSFYKNKLYQITVSFGSVDREYTLGEESMMLYGLKASFGTITHDCKGSEPKDLSVLNCTIWDGRKISLEHLRVDFKSTERNSEKKTNSILGYILYTDKKAQKEQHDD